MEEPVSPLVLTKLRLPAVRARIISRTRLVDILAPENGASFVLVCAPAGYGKTTLLAEWAQTLMKKGTAVAWYALDQSDLERQLDLATAHDLTHRVIELSLLEALASQSEGNLEHARTALEHALRLAHPEGYLRIFDQGTTLTRLLRAEATQQGVFKEYIERILVAIGKPEVLNLGREGSGVRSAQVPYGESLSERELEVLRLIAQGATNQEIAEQLVITVGTVKSHINHILGKLDSHNRTEAVARARVLGLLDI